MSTRPAVRHAVRLAAAVLATAAAGVGVVAAPAPPAHAAACAGSTGVTVVVDHGALGGGVDQSCNAGGGGKSASTQFTSVGYSFTYVQRQPGFVCRINGQPASDPCVNTPPVDAYWGLWWSDGVSGSWSYSSLAAGSLTIPDGGYVAFAWQSGARSAPGAPATAHPSSPSTPTSTPTSGGNGGGNGGGGGGNGGGGGGGGGGHTSASPTTKPSPSAAHPSPSTKPSSPAPSPTTSSSGSASGSVAPSAGAPDQTSAASTSEATESRTTPPTSASESAVDTSAASTAPAEGSLDASQADQSTLPVWVVPLVLLVLAAGGVAAYLVRRRGRAHP